MSRIEFKDFVILFAVTKPCSVNRNILSHIALFVKKMTKKQRNFRINNFSAKKAQKKAVGVLRKKGVNFLLILIKKHLTIWLIFIKIIISAEFKMHIMFD